MKIIASITLFLSVFSFSMPREYFDPHLGMDYDIYCIIYFNLAIYTHDEESFHLVVTFEGIEYVPAIIHRIFTQFLDTSRYSRAPPAWPVAA